MGEDNELKGEWYFFPRPDIVMGPYKSIEEMDRAQEQWVAYIDNAGCCGQGI